MKPGSVRVYHGGSNYDHYNGDSLRWVARYMGFPREDYTRMGFRVASVPEPSTLLLLGLGAVMLRKRR